MYCALFQRIAGGRKLLTLGQSRQWINLLMKFANVLISHIYVIMRTVITSLHSVKVCNDDNDVVLITNSLRHLERNEVTFSKFRGSVAGKHGEKDMLYSWKRHRKMRKRVRQLAEEVLQANSKGQSPSRAVRSTLYLYSK